MASGSTSFGSATICRRCRKRSRRGCLWAPGRALKKGQALLEVAAPQMAVTGSTKACSRSARHRARGSERILAILGAGSLVGECAVVDETGEVCFGSRSGQQPYVRRSKAFPRMPENIVPHSPPIWWIRWSHD